MPIPMMILENINITLSFFFEKRNRFETTGQEEKSNETFAYFEVKRRNVFGFNNAQQWKETHGQNARDRHWYALGYPIGR